MCQYTKVEHLVEQSLRGTKNHLQEISEDPLQGISAPYSIELLCNFIKKLKQNAKVKIRLYNSNQFFSTKSVDLSKYR